MICYPEIKYEEEVNAINDYWEYSSLNPTVFKYKINEINIKYKNSKCRSLALLTSQSEFLIKEPEFKCKDCESYVPVRTRKRLIQRYKIDNFYCIVCQYRTFRELQKDFLATIYSFKRKELITENYLDNLNYIELIFVLFIAEKYPFPMELCSTNIHFLFLTGLIEIDEPVTDRLESKKAITKIQQVPENVMSASIQYLDICRLVRYIKWTDQKLTSEYSELAIEGIYLNNHTQDCHHKDSLIRLTKEKLKLYKLSHSDIEEVKDIILRIQARKLYHLMSGIARKYRIHVENSNKLHAITFEIANIVSPSTALYIYDYIAKKVIIEERKRATPKYISKHYFSKFTADFLAKKTKNSWAFNKGYKLPENLIIYSFEQRFSEKYLNAENWNSLSTNEIISKWISHPEISIGG